MAVSSLAVLGGVLGAASVSPSVSKVASSKVTSTSKNVSKKKSSKPNVKVRKARSTVKNVTQTSFLTLEKTKEKFTPLNPEDEVYAENYGKYLISSKDKNWFKWSYEKRFLKLNAPKDKFSTAKSADDLGNLCKEAYQKDYQQVSALWRASSITYKEEITKTNGFLETNVWKYCSPWASKPVTLAFKVEDYSYGNDKNEDLVSFDWWGNYEEVQDYLVAVTPKENAKFWEAKSNEYKNTRVRSSAMVVKNNDIKAWCKSAYATKSPAKGKLGKKANQYNATNVFKWCSLTGNVPQVHLTVPNQGK